ncbi:MAG: hypothetical protein PHV13_05580 [Candidatus ainarchaeum sp.]|nr:hypothetical protein [Candidatus ainarchaeum sp.]
MPPTLTNCKVPAGGPTAGAGHEEEWVAAIRHPLVTLGIPAGRITHLNASFFIRQRPEISTIVENAGGHMAGRRRGQGLGSAGKAQIAVALGFMDAPDGVLAKIATDLAAISRNSPGGEEPACELVMRFSDLPYAAAALAQGFRAISEALRGEPGFYILAKEFMRLMPPRPASGANPTETPGPLAYFPITSMMLLKKIEDLMYGHGAPTIVHLKLSHSENAREALEGLNGCFLALSGRRQPDFPA